MLIKYMTIQSFRKLLFRQVITQVLRNEVIHFEKYQPSNVSFYQIY